MSSVPTNAKEGLDQLQLLAEEIEPLSDSRLQARAADPGSRTLILEFRQLLGPWLLPMARLDRLDRRLERALKRTRQERWL